MSKNKPTWKRGLQTFAIILILVIFPLGSWYFLQSGFNFTKDKFEQLDSLGHVQNMIYPIKDQKSLNIDQWEEDIVLIANASKSTQADLDILESLYKKFDARNDLNFLIYDNETTNYSSDPLFKSYTFHEDFRQVKIIDANAMKADEFYQSLGLSKMPSSSEIVLLDTGNEVRGIYNIHDEKDRDLLISHIVYLLPKE